MYRFLSSQKSLPGTPRAPARMHISLHGGKGFANLTRRRRPSSASVLLVAGFGAFLAFLDSTIVNIAFPDIQRSFPSYDIGSLSWILNGYNIVFAAFMVAAGRLADLLGRRRTFLSGVLVFTIASGLCAVAGSVEQLVAFRVLQGIGAAILVPASLAVEDAGWRDFCLRVADRIVLVAGDPNPQAARLPARARGADLVLAGPAASREHRRQWEELITPRSVHVVHYRRILENVRPLAARIAGRSIGLVLGGGGARGFAHLGVLDELERVGVTIDRFAGTSMGAVIAVFGACGMDAATADAYAYEYFIRHNPLSDYAFPVRGLVRGRRTLTLLEAAFGDRLVEELPKEFRCVSVDLLARRPVVHRRGRLVDVIGCSLRLPGIYPPQVYNGRLHVDGGVLDNLPVSTRASPDGPLIAVSIGLGGGGPGSARQDGSPKVPGIGDTLMRTMTIGSQRGADAALSLAQVVIRPDTGAVGLLEFHQIDAAREAGRVAAREAMPHIMALLNR